MKLRDYANIAQRGDTVPLQKSDSDRSIAMRDLKNATEVHVQKTNHRIKREQGRDKSKDRRVLAEDCGQHPDQEIHPQHKPGSSLIFPMVWNFIRDPPSHTKHSLTLTSLSTPLMCFLPHLVKSVSIYVSVLVTYYDNYTSPHNHATSLATNAPTPNHATPLVTHS